MVHTWSGLSWSLTDMEVPHRWLGERFLRPCMFTSMVEHREKLPELRGSSKRDAPCVALIRSQSPRSGLGLIWRRRPCLGPLEGWSSVCIGRRQSSPTNPPTPAAKKAWMELEIKNGTVTFSVSNMTCTRHYSGSVNV